MNIVLLSHQTVFLILLLQNSMRNFLGKNVYQQIKKQWVSKDENGDIDRKQWVMQLSTGIPEGFRKFVEKNTRQRKYMEGNELQLGDTSKSKRRKTSGKPDFSNQNQLKTVFLEWREAFYQIDFEVSTLTSFKRAICDFVPNLKEEDIKMVFRIKGNKSICIGTDKALQQIQDNECIQLSLIGDAQEET
eukprot:gb/GECH01008948.1/.p1 GENE.gb/GECH01008948.1/~~gb/GECH01008948.1/.p1  ORF type:complete len:189 (+),score=33.16 gb/GECH01008948.1/:1-567(+)